MDWNGWHKRYDTTPALAARLRIVCGQIMAALEECPPGPVRIVSLCAGDGRDVIEALAGGQRCDDVHAWLLDTHGESLARGASAAAAAGLNERIKFIHADAGVARSYVSLVPADMVLLSGFLGHIRRADIPGLIISLPMLCRTGASVIWNKHLVANDGGTRVAMIREMLERAGFVEVSFERTSDDGYAVGRSRFTGVTAPLDEKRALFEFASHG